jgi:hypothetical protein
MRIKVIKNTAAIGIELRYHRLRCTREPSRPAIVIERDNRSSRLNAMINFRRGYYKSVAGKSRRCPNHRTRKLKNVRVKQYSWITTFALRKGDKRPHRSTISRDIDVFRRNHHFIPGTLR